MDMFRTLVIAAQDADNARAIAAAFGPGGTGMWTTPLSATGAEPASHYISSGYIPQEFVSLAPCTEWAMDEDGNWIAVSTYEGDAATVYAYAEQAGLGISLADIQGIFARADVSAQEPFVHMGRMGVQIINPPLGV